jgi:hypothetical protein
MMKNKIILLSLMIFINVFVIKAQEKSKLEIPIQYKHSIGIGAGFTTGCGLSYRFIPKDIGFQINVFPFYTDYGKKITASFGFTVLDKIYEGRSCNVYAYFGNHYYIDKYNYDYNGYQYYQNQNVSKYNSGIGLDLEFSTQKRIVLHVMAGLAQYNTFEMLLPTAELALHYRFVKK